MRASITREIKNLLEQTSTAEGYLELLEKPIEYVETLHRMISELYQSGSNMNNDVLYKLLKHYYEMTPLSRKLKLADLNMMIKRENPQTKVIALKILEAQGNRLKKEDVEILFMVAQHIPVNGVTEAKEQEFVLNELAYSHPMYDDDLLLFEGAIVALKILNNNFAEGNSSEEDLSERLKWRKQILCKIVGKLQMYFNPKDQRHLNMLKSDDKLLKRYVEYSIEVFRFSPDLRDETLKNVAFSTLLFGHNLDSKQKERLLELLILKDSNHFSIDFIIDRATIHHGLSDYGKMLFVKFVYQCLVVQRKNYEGFERILSSFIYEVKKEHGDSSHVDPENIQTETNVCPMGFYVKTYVKFLYDVLGEDNIGNIRVSLRHTDILYISDFLIDKNMLSGKNDEEIKSSVLELISVYISYLNKKGIVMYYEDHMVMKELFLVPVKLNPQNVSDKFYQMFLLLGEAVFNTIVSLVSEDLIVKYYDRVHVWRGILSVGTSAWLIVCKKANELVFADFISNQFKSPFFYKSIFPILYHFVLHDKDFYRRYFSNYFTTIFKLLITYNGSPYSPHFTTRDAISILRDMFIFLNTKTNLYAGYCITYSHIDLITIRLFELYCIRSDVFFLDVLFRLPSSFALLQTKFKLFEEPIIHGIRNKLVSQQHFTNFIVHIALFDSKNLLDEILAELFILLGSSNRLVKDNVMGILTKLSGKHIEKFTPQLFLGQKERCDSLYELYVEMLIGKRPVYTEKGSFFLVDYGNTNDYDEKIIDEAIACLKGFFDNPRNILHLPVIARKVFVGLLICKKSQEWLRFFVGKNVKMFYSSIRAGDFPDSSLGNKPHEEESFYDFFRFNYYKVLEVFLDAFRLAVVYESEVCHRIMGDIQSIAVYNRFVVALTPNLYSSNTLSRFSTLRFLQDIRLDILNESVVLSLRNALNFVQPLFTSFYLPESAVVNFSVASHSLVHTMKHRLLRALGRLYRCVFTNIISKPILNIALIMYQKYIFNPVKHEGRYAYNESVDRWEFFHEDGMQKTVVDDDSTRIDRSSSCKSFNPRIRHFLFYEQTRRYYTTDDLLAYIDHLTSNVPQNSKSIINHLFLFQKLKRIFSLQLVDSEYTLDKFTTIYKKIFPAIAVLDNSTLDDVRRELLHKFCNENSITSDLFSNSLKLIALIFYNQRVPASFVTLFMRAYDTQPREIVYEILANFRENERTVIEYLIKLNKKITQVMKMSIRRLIVQKNCDTRGIEETNFLFYLLNYIEIPFQRKILYDCVDCRWTNPPVLLAIVEYLNKLIGSMESTGCFQSPQSRKMYQNNCIDFVVKAFYIIEYLSAFNLTFNNTTAVKNIIIGVSTLIDKQRLEKILEIYANIFDDDEISEILYECSHLIIRSQSIFHRILTSSSKLNEQLIPSLIYLIENFRTYDITLISKAYYTSDLPLNIDIDLPQSMDIDLPQKIDMDFQEESTCFDIRNLAEEFLSSLGKLVRNRNFLENQANRKFIIKNSWKYLVGYNDVERNNYKDAIDKEIKRNEAVHSHYTENVNFDCLIVAFTDKIEVLIDLFNRRNIYSQIILEIARTTVTNRDSNIGRMATCLSYIRKFDRSSMDIRNVLFNHFYLGSEGLGRTEVLWDSTCLIDQDLDLVTLYMLGMEKRPSVAILENLSSRFDKSSFLHTMHVMEKDKYECVEIDPKRFNFELCTRTNTTFSIKHVETLHHLISSDELPVFISPTILHSAEVLMRIVSPSHDFVRSLSLDDAFTVLSAIVDSQDASEDTRQLVKICLDEIFANNYKNINKFACLYERCTNIYPTEVRDALLADDRGYPPALARIHLLFDHLSMEDSVSLACKLKPTRLSSEIFLTNLFHLLVRFPDLVQTHVSTILMSRDKRLVELIASQPSLLSLYANNEDQVSRILNNYVFDLNYVHWILLVLQRPPELLHTFPYVKGTNYHEILRSVSADYMSSQVTGIENHRSLSRKLMAGVCKVHGRTREVKILGKLLLLKEYAGASAFYRIVVDRIAGRKISYARDEIDIIERVNSLVLRKLCKDDDNIQGLIDIDTSLCKPYQPTKLFRDVNEMIDSFMQSFGNLMKLILFPQSTSPHSSISINSLINNILTLYSNYIHLIPKSKYLNTILSNLTIMTEIKNSMEIMNRPTDVILSFIKIWSYRFPVDEFIYFCKWRTHVLEKQLLTNQTIVENIDNKRKIQLLVCGIKLKYADKLINRKKYKIAQCILNDGMHSFLIDLSHKLYKLLMDLECSYYLREYPLMLSMICAFNASKCKNDERGLIYYWAYKAKKAMDSLGLVDVSPLAGISTGSLFKLCKNVFYTSIIREEEYSLASPGTHEKMLLDIINENPFSVSIAYIIDLISINPLLLLKIDPDHRVSYLYMVETLREDRVKEIISEKFSDLFDDHYSVFSNYTTGEHVFPENTILIGECNMLTYYSSSKNTEGPQSSATCPAEILTGYRTMFSIVSKLNNLFVCRLTDGSTVRLDFEDHFKERLRIESLRKKIDKKTRELNDYIQAIQQGTSSISTESSGDSNILDLLTQINDFKKLASKSFSSDCYFKFCELLCFRLKFSSLSGWLFQRYRGILVIEKVDLRLNEFTSYSSIISFFHSLSRNQTSLVTLKFNFLKSYSLYLFFSLVFSMHFDGLYINVETGHCKYKKAVVNKDASPIARIPSSVIGLLVDIDETDLNGIVLGFLYSFIITLLRNLLSTDDLAVRKIISYFFDDTDDIIERINRLFIDTPRINSFFGFNSQDSRVPTCELCVNSSKLSIILCSCKISINNDLVMDNLISEYLECFKIEKYLNSIIKLNAGRSTSKRKKYSCEN